MSTGTSLPISALTVALVAFGMTLLLAACAPAVVRVVVRPCLGRWDLRRRGVGVGARVVYQSWEATLERLTVRSACLIGDDGKVLFLDNHRLARDAQVVAQTGEPVAVRIRLVVPGDTSVPLVRQIAIRAAESSACRHPGRPVTVRALSVRLDEVEFVVTAFARQPAHRDELTSQVLQKLYVGLHAAGIHARRAGLDRGDS